MNLPYGLLKNAIDSFRHLKHLTWQKHEREKVGKDGRESLYCVVFLICLFFRSQSYLVLLFFNKSSVFLAKTKAFFKKHSNPYHITVQF